MIHELMTEVIQKLLSFLEKNPKLTWFFILSYITLIFYFSSIPHPTQPIKGFEEEAPIIEHIIEFAILGLLLFPGFRSLGYYKYALFFSLIFGISYGIFDEVHQYFVPGRDACILDMVINSIGTVIGVMVMRLNSK
jgi:VanZ family protein